MLYGQYTAVPLCRSFLLTPFPCSNLCPSHSAGNIFFHNGTTEHLLFLLHLWQVFPEVCYTSLLVGCFLFVLILGVWVWFFFCFVELRLFSFSAFLAFSPFVKYVLPGLSHILLMGSAVASSGLIAEPLCPSQGSPTFLQGPFRQTTSATKTCHFGKIHAVHRNLLFITIFDRFVKSS